MRLKSCTMAVKAAGEADGTPDGQFEAIVATYDLDSYGDRIIPGAFKETLAEWKAKGDPIPVIWSHMSFDPDCHIGTVMEAAERDEGLWVKAQLDMEQPKAAQVYRLLKSRRVTQFSFAFDVEEGAWVEPQDEAPFYELRKMKLYEVGPCLIGVNQETELLTVKAADGRDVRIEMQGPTPDQAASIRAAVEAVVGAKAGRVLSAKNEESLKGALNKIGDGVADVKSVLSSLGKEDDANKSAVTTHDENEAQPGGQHAAVEEPPGAKTDEPARPAPASLRVRAALDTLAAEVDSLTI